MALPFWMDVTVATSPDAVLVTEMLCSPRLRARSRATALTVCGPTGSGTTARKVRGPLAGTAAPTQSAGQTTPSTSNQTEATLKWLPRPLST